jgi:hypothetical protein
VLNNERGKVVRFGVLRQCNYLVVPLTLSIDRVIFITKSLILQFIYNLSLFKFSIKYFIAKEIPIKNVINVLNIIRYDRLSPQMIIVSF